MREAQCMWRLRVASLHGQGFPGKGAVPRNPGWLLSGAASVGEKLAVRPQKVLGEMELLCAWIVVVVVSCRHLSKIT